MSTSVIDEMGWMIILELELCFLAAGFLLSERCFVPLLRAAGDRFIMCRTQYE
jgi:hypothetical protein